jgi:ABC-type transport system involved in multi-copper enzyme maturation permease subunit
MLATEAKRVLKDGTVIFAVLAALIAGIRFSDQDAVLAPALEIFLLLYAAFSGWSLFERERQENAGDFMLSLPLSRSRLLLLKFLPRLLGASFLLIICACTKPALPGFVPI